MSERSDVNAMSSFRNRMHPLAELLRHRARTILVIMTLAMTVCDWITRPAADLPSMLVGLLHVCGIVYMLWMPRAGALSVTAVEIICCLHPIGTGASRMWGGCLAAGLFVYTEGTFSSAVVWLFMNLLIQLLQTSFSMTDTPMPGKLSLHGTAFIMSCLTIAEAIGCACRRYQDHARSKEQEYRNLLRQQDSERRLANLHYAAELHDSVTGSLADMALIAQQRLVGIKIDETKAWEYVNRESQKALSQTHRIIDLLSEEQEHIEKKYGADLRRTLATRCSKHDEALPQRLSGKSVVRDFGLTVEPQNRNVQALTSLIDELYSNMAKYAGSSKPYELSIILCDDYAEIILTNAVDEQRSLSFGGKGLQVHNKQIHQLNGTYSVNEKHGRWIYSAHLPLR